MRNPMFVHDEALTELILAYCRRRVALDPVPLDFGGATQEALGNALTGMIGELPHDPGHVLEVFGDRLASAVISCDSPRFLSFIPAAPTKASLLFDMVVSASSMNGTSWLEAAGAVVAENQALAVLAGLAGFPARAGGCFVPGGTAGNLAALVVARDTGPERIGRTPTRPRMAVSEEVHSSVIQALHVIGTEPLLVPTHDHRMTGATLQRALEGPGGEDVVGVVATAGTTNAGLMDDLAGVAEVAERARLWFHVDGAYGAAALFAPSARPLFAGLERADSFIVDPHKWLFAPYDCAALLYRRPELARAVHSQQAAYLQVMETSDPDEPGDQPWNPSDYAVHLTRRARGLPLWFSLAVHGTRAYADAVETVLATARQAAALIDTRPGLDLVRPPELSVVLFRRRGWRWEDYTRWSTRILTDQVAFVTPTTWEGEPTARLAFLHPDTTLEMVEEILDTMGEG